jgi:hypothetical protein
MGKNRRISDMPLKLKLPETTPKHPDAGSTGSTRLP